MPTSYCPHCGHTALAGETLTHREIEILGLSAQGDTAREIAEKLFVSVNTVRNHLQHIFRKLGVSGGGASRKAVAAAQAKGLLPPAVLAGVG